MFGEKQNLKALERASQGTLASRFYPYYYTSFCQDIKILVG